MDSKSGDYGDEGKENDFKGGDEKSSKISNNELLQKTQMYFYTDEELLTTFESFAQSHCHQIDLDTDEYKLKYTELYNEYKSLFEFKLESYIKSLGCTALDLFDALKEATDEDANSNDAVFGQILFAVSDFDIFMTMMREAAQADESRSMRK
jgi:hypothetical protein